MNRVEEWKDSLKIFIPGKYPSKILEEYKDNFKKAGILNPEEFLKNMSLSSFIITLALSILIFIIEFIHPIRVGTSAVSNPIPENLRPYVYALSVYLTQPLIFKFLLFLTVSGKISARRENIDFNIHSLYIALLGFARARSPLKDIIREIMIMDLGEISKEFARIYYAVRYGNATLKVAMLEVAATTPSQKLSELLRGIVSVTEAGGDLARFIEDRLQSIEVEKKVLYTQYLKKLELLAEVYLTVTLAIPIVIISIQLAKSVVGQADIMSVYGVIYVLMPLATFAIVLILYASSPEKNIERRGSAWLLIIIFAGFLGFIIGWLLGSVEFWTVLFITIGSAIAHLILSKLVKEEDKISLQLPLYFNKILALVEAGKDITTAFKLAAYETEQPLRKYVSVFAEMLDKGVSRDKAFKWLYEKSPNADLKIISKILAKTVDVGGKLSPILLSLVNELARLNSFRKERDSSAKTYAGLMILATILFLGIAALLSSSLIGEFEKAIEKTKAGSGVGVATTFAINQYIINQARTLLRHATYIVSFSAALGIAAMKGDFRRAPLPLAILFTLTLVVCILYLRLSPF